MKTKTYTNRTIYTTVKLITLLLIGSLSISIGFAQTTYYSRVDGDWSNTSTWSTTGCGGSEALTTPSATDDVVICAGDTVSLSNDVAIVNLTINFTGLLDVTTNNHNISVAGDWTNSSDANFIGLSARSGSVTCNGASLQEIQGDTKFHNLVVDNAAGVNVISGTQQLEGTLTLTNGVFNTNDALVLLSDLNSTARIAEITGGSITGDVNMQRYVEQGSTSWRFFSTPVSGTTLADWDDDFSTAGFPGSDAPSFGFTSIYTYDEPTMGSSENGYVAPTDISDPISVGAGYWVYLGPLPLTFSVTGPVNSGNISLPVTYTDDISQPSSEDGWNMVGNPYPSSIDWDSPYWTKTNIGATIYIYREDGSYATYPSGGPGTNGGTKDIASSQGFWVKATGFNPALSMTEGVKSNTDVSFLKTTGPVPHMKLSVTNNGYQDEAIVRFYPGASDSLDDFDGHKLMNSNTQIPNISTMVNNTDLVINSMSEQINEFNIPVKALFPSTGSYTITITKESLNLPSASLLILEDLVTGAITDLMTDSTYTFSVNTLSANPRFMLRLKKGFTQSNSNVTCNGLSNGSVSITPLGIGPWNYAVLNTQGDTVHSLLNSWSSDTAEGLAAGVYTAHVSDLGGYNIDVSQEVTIAAPLGISVQSTVNEPTCFGDSDASITLSATGGTGSYIYSWWNSDTGQTINGLSIGVYEAVVTDANGCKNGASVTVAEPALLSYTYQLSNVTCNGDNDGEIDLSAKGGTAPYDYNWSNAEFSEDLTGLSSGSYSVTITDNNGCVTMGTIDITEPEMVEAKFDIASNMVLLSDGGNGIFTNTSTGADSYEWDFADGSYSTEENPVHTYIEAGYYQVYLTAFSGVCSSQANAPIEVIDTGVGMDSEMGQGGEINITQSDAKLLISFNLSQAQEVEVSVFNMEGQYIVQSDQINVSNETLSYDLPDGASGLYFLRITRTNTISVSKFFINNN
jgi:hypothetical protein